MEITREAVEQAAKEKGFEGIEIMQAITLMQAVAAQIGDDNTLNRLCDIKHEILEEWSLI